MAGMVGHSPAGQVAFATTGRVIASTLDATEVRTLTPAIAAGLSRNALSHTLKLGDEAYMASSDLLQGATDMTPSIYLVLLQSDKEKTALLRQLNGGILAISWLLLLVGGSLALALAGTVTRPLYALLQSTRPMERGEVIAPVPATGSQELRELREAFEKMHAEVLSSQARLLEGERQATIGVWQVPSRMTCATISRPSMRMLSFSLQARCPARSGLSCSTGLRRRPVA
jgi:HAMP domain-containing protein